ncbi:hypothetical protein [Novosphingobium cyanobacteriorum]|uniref:Lipoprotein n=1 Tax=Novosphingobium cyanobacteriorum TaxID=3024215 RepID=A0ABT6CCY9_9SPHN|nr:hypothetical protein [Novosphingobium cyanobacteriorum]MDF8331798.1 hypothetical protein [Novosphingobium cyanobacteriorum]
MIKAQTSTAGGELVEPPQRRDRISAIALILAVGMAFGLTGCVSKLAEGRVRSALVASGLSDANAACMAERMTDRLSIGQLRKLQALQGPKRSLADWTAAVRRVGDRQLIEVTGSSALLCATGFAPEKKRR